MAFSQSVRQHLHEQIAEQCNIRSARRAFINMTGAAATRGTFTSDELLLITFMNNLGYSSNNLKEQADVAMGFAPADAEVMSGGLRS